MKRVLGFILFIISGIILLFRYLDHILYVRCNNLFYLSRHHCIISALAVIVFAPLVDCSLIRADAIVACR